MISTWYDEINLDGLSIETVKHQPDNEQTLDKLKMIVWNSLGSVHMYPDNYYPILSE